MTVEADLKSALAGCCARVFPDFAPTNTTKPYITYQQIGGTVINPLDNSNPAQQNGEFQINVWANSRASAASVMLAIEAAMRAATTFTAQPIAAPRGDFDADMLLYASSQDYSVWSDK
jgi:hypothetical protein